MLYTNIKEAPSLHLCENLCLRRLKERIKEMQKNMRIRRERKRERTDLVASYEWK